MRARTWMLLTVAAIAVAGLTWVAVTPIASTSREQVFVIPKGTWARRMAGEKIETLPDHADHAGREKVALGG